MDQLINIQNQAGILTVSSREIAKNFDKDHTKVIRAIEDLLGGIAKNGDTLFIPTEYQHEQNKQWYKEYQISRDGFSLLVMGFTGQKALEWKLKYIEAFNMMEQNWNSPERVMARALKIADEKLHCLQLENIQQKQIIGELKPRADYTDSILNNPGLVTITQIAKDYGMSGKAFNELLHELKIQYKQSDQWLLYSEYHDKGYTHSQTVDILRTDGRKDVKMNTKWTQKGRLFIYQLLKSNGYLPVIEKEEPIRDSVIERRCK